MKVLVVAFFLFSLSVHATQPEKNCLNIKSGKCIPASAQGCSKGNALVVGDNKCSQAAAVVVNQKLQTQSLNYVSAELVKLNYQVSEPVTASTNAK